MTRIVAVLVHLLLVLMGYIAACLATSACINILFLASQNIIEDWSLAVGAGSLFFSIPFVALFVAYFAFVPAILAILAAEILGRRDWLFYALAGAVVGGVVAAFFGVAMNRDDVLDAPFDAAALVAAGVVAGVTYWITAGRLAGNWRQKRPQVVISPERSGS